jgi:uncharacterized protein (TIGR02569 family)
VSASLRAAAQAFGAEDEPRRLARGAWRAGAIVLKEARDRPEFWTALAETATQAKHSTAVRIPRPLRTQAGSWIAEGHVAWQYLEGREAKGRYAEKLRACDAFSEAFAAVERPAYFDLRDDPWCRADRFAWDEAEAPRDGRFVPLVDDLRRRLRPLHLPQQLIHGDIAGNMIFAEGLPIGVIDLTLYWRPVAFAKAVLVVDTLAWEGADPVDFAAVVREPEMHQLLLRAALRRVLEQQEQIPACGKSPPAAIEDAESYRTALHRLGLL